MTSTQMQAMWNAASGGDASALDEIFASLQRGLRGDTVLFGELWSARPTPELRAHRIGLVGPPGTGKSTVLGHLAARHPEAEKVGVVSVDATGHCGQGHRLGDRLRMNALDLAPNLCVRTLDVRPGDPAPGLFASLSADIFDALGCDPIFLESVGMARAQVEIVRRVHTVVLLVPPSVEDPDQLVASGLLDLADLVVLNKCDLEGAEAVAATLDRALASRSGEDDPRPDRVFRTTALRDEGLDELFQGIRTHASALRADGVFASRSRAQVAEQLKYLVFEMLRARWQGDVGLRALLDECARGVLEGDRNLVDTADEVAAMVTPPRP